MTTEQASDIQRRMYTFIVNYMKAEGMPPTNREIGRALGISSTGHVDYHLTMLEKKNMISRTSKKSRGIKLVKAVIGIPVKGRIAAGEPLFIAEEPEEMIDVGRDMELDNTYALIVNGRSMIEDHILNGDYVVVRPQSDFNNGDIVVATHNEETGSRATLKRCFKEQDRIRLQPANSEFNPIYVSSDEWKTEWVVQGKVVAIFRQYHAA
ncbi:MAG TPA: transcriptional repressor LexA [Ktedonobacteraceae bacterium]|nr:transcriptional repressor LexA [Ktedonobacteraceae bacterium]